VLVVIYDDGKRELLEKGVFLFASGHTAIVKEEC